MKFIHVSVCISVVYSFSCLLIFHCTNMSYFKSPFFNIWVVFYKAVINHIFSFSLGKYLAAALLRNRICMSNFIDLYDIDQKSIAHIWVPLFLDSSFCSFDLFSYANIILALFLKLCNKS